MEKIYSKIDANNLLHIIWRSTKGEKGKMNFIIPENEYLQAAKGINIPEGHTFNGPHKHLPQERNTKKTQESIVIINGSIEVEMYDTDDMSLGKDVLNSGDCYVYLGGGHSYKVLTPNTSFYEFKNGPYMGEKNDRKPIN